MDTYTYRLIASKNPVLPVATHAEYIEFKIMIKDPLFKKPRSNHPPHDAHKNIDWNVFAKAWNVRVNTQDRTITDSDRRLYYKLPGQLEAHHKKTILFKSELSTLYFGPNAVALTAFADLIASEENSAITLPPILLPNQVPDDALKTGTSAFLSYLIYTDHDFSSGSV